MTIGLAGGIAGLVCLRLSRGVTKKKRPLTPSRRLRTLLNSESNLMTAYLSCTITSGLCILSFVINRWLACGTFDSDYIVGRGAGLF